MAAPASSEEQARLLEDALAVVRQQTAMMRRCLETPGKLMDALKCCSTLVSELRTSILGPKQYYELYMAVFDALRHLSVYLRDSHPMNHLADLYELVQYAGNIIPRLYLMITVGTVYMGIPDAPVKEIMKDMMEMSRGVQHPMRGLFLRYYLSGQARDHMPTGVPRRKKEVLENGEMEKDEPVGGEEIESEEGIDPNDPAGSLQDSISFTLTNFVEMNKLWVRLQHLGHSREREQRMKERQELQLLVGSNLERLSRLVDLETYKAAILGPLLEQVVQCRDVLAQEYLLEVITQVFPDEFHLHTLDKFLAATARLNPHVNVKAIVIGLMDRLSAYAVRDADTRTPEEKAASEEEATRKLFEQLRLAREEKAQAPAAAPAESQAANGETNGAATGDANQQPPAAKPVFLLNGEHKPRGIPEDIRLFEIFHEQVMNLADAQRLPIQDIIALLVSLTNLALNIYPDRLDYVDSVLKYATEKTQQFSNGADLHSHTCQYNIQNLLLAPIKSYVSLFTALALPSFIPLLQSQTYPIRRALAGEVSKSLLRNETKISTEANLESVLGIVKVLIKEGMQQTGYPGGPSRRGQESDDTLEEQGWLARLVHLIQSNNNETQLRLLQNTRKAFSEGNERIRYTFPALATSSFKLARRLKSREHFDDSWKTTSQTLYKFIHSMLSTLYARGAAGASSQSAVANSPGSAVSELSLRLFLGAGQIADHAGFMEISYEFFAQAFTIYEESISDSRAQYQSVCCIASALYTTRNFSKEEYDTLITKCTLHGSKLLKKPDQCRAVCAVSHLWWVNPPPLMGKVIEEGKESPGRIIGGYKDGKRVLECLQRALKVADACMDAAVSVELFVETLGQYVYFYDQECEAVTTKFINGLIELIHSNLATSEPSSAMDAPRKHFERTLEYIRGRDFEGVVTDPKT